MTIKEGFTAALPEGEVEWGTWIEVKVPEGFAGHLQYWGLGPGCGGLATHHSVQILEGGRAFWHVGPPEDAGICRSTGVTEHRLVVLEDIDSDAFAVDAAGDWRSGQTTREVCEAALSAATVMTVTTTPPPAEDSP